MDTAEIKARFPTLDALFTEYLAQELDADGQTVDLSDLPVYSAHPPADTLGVWSYSRTCQIDGGSADLIGLRPDLDVTVRGLPGWTARTVRGYIEITDPAGTQVYTYNAVGRCIVWDVRAERNRLAALQVLDTHLNTVLTHLDVTDPAEVR